MEQRVVGPELEAAVRTITRLKQFPIALWNQSHFNEYNHAFEVFWKFGPTREQFSMMMHSAPVTADMMWIMTRGK